MEDFERRIFGPPDGTAILPWYDGAYDCAFVALHPFFTIDGLDPAICAHGSLILSGAHQPADLGLLEWAERQEKSRLVGKELSSHSIDDASKLFGSAITWRTMNPGIGFADHRTLNQALRTHIGGLKPEFADPVGADKLASYCARSRIFLPTEGTLQPLMESQFVELFKRCGFRDLIIADEFGDDEHLVSLGALDTAISWRSSTTLPLPFPKRLFAEDRSLLVAVDWDSFFTLILANNQRAADARIGDIFEGFWANSETSIGWLFQPLIPLVD